MREQRPTFLRQKSDAAASLSKVPPGMYDRDDILHGGFPEGRTTRVSGGPGTGKTILGLEFLYRSAMAGQAGVFLSFEGSQETLISAMFSPGLDLGLAVEADRLEFLTIMPEAMGAEQHLARALERIEAFRPEHVVADTMSATLRMDADKAAFDYVMRLVDVCSKRSHLYHKFLMDHGVDVTEMPGEARSSLMAGRTAII